MKSGLYEGTLYHSRRDATRHDFRYRLFLLYLDLEELPRVFERRWLWSSRRPNLVWFRRADYMGPADRPLDEVVRDRVEEELGRRPRGAVRMLTQLRTFGYVFNPVTFYYCFDEHDRLEAVASEITNTPWRERHTYVVDARTSEDPELAEARFAKTFHVSPFFDMDHEYRWRFSAPGESLGVHMTNVREGSEVFHAGLECRRKELSGGTLAAALLTHPLLTLRVHLAIYWQAARLWWKRAPFHVHPSKRPLPTKST